MLQCELKSMEGALADGTPVEGKTCVTGGLGFSGI